MANYNPGYDFSNGEEVTPTKLETLISDATPVQGVVHVNAIPDGGIPTAKMADAAITAAKIADAVVATAKLADASVTTPKIADENVTTAKIADANVTTAKIADGAVTPEKLAAGGVVPPAVYLAYRVTENENGATPTKDAWTDYPLNAELYDANNECTLADSEFTLAAGTWEIEFEAELFVYDNDGGSHSFLGLRLHDGSAEINWKGTSTPLRGARGRQPLTVEASSAYHMAATWKLFGVFEASGSQAFSVQYFFAHTSAQNASSPLVAYLGIAPRVSRDDRGTPLVTMNPYIYGYCKLRKQL